MSALVVNSGTLGFGDARTVTCSALVLDLEAYVHTVTNRLPTWISITDRHFGSLVAVALLIDQGLSSLEHHQLRS